MTMQKFFVFVFFEMQMMQVMHVAWNARQHAALEVYDNANTKGLTPSKDLRSPRPYVFKVSPDHACLRSRQTVCV